MRILTLLLFLISTFRIGAQNPTHFTIGQLEFAATDVYGLVETPDGRFFAATNTGLYEYKSGAFQSIQSAPSHIGNSLFNLICDSNGEVLCGNLSGQIFKLEDDHLVLLTTIPKEHIGTQFEFKFTKENELLYASKNCVVLKNGKLSLLLRSKNEFEVFALSREENEILITASFEDKVYRYSSQEGITLHPISGNKVTDPTIKLSRRIFHLDKIPFSSYSNGIITNELNQRQTDLQLVPREILSKGSSTDFWGINPHLGIRRIHLANGQLKQDPSIFKSVFISSITFGKNGTMYLGTFNSGVIVVPNYKIQEHIPPEALKMTGIVATEDGVFMSSRKSIYIYNSDFQEISTKSNQTFDKIFQLGDKNPLLVNSKYPGLVYDEVFINSQRSMFGTIKDIYYYDESTYLIASSTGIFKVGASLNRFSWIKTASTVMKLNIGSERCNAIYAAPNGSYLLIAAQSNLIKFNPDGTQEAVKYKGKDVVCVGFYEYDSKVYLATYENGILIWENSKLNPFDSGRSLPNFGTISKILVHRNILFCSTAQGMHLYHFSTKNWSEIGVSEGLMHGSVTDFSIYKNTLWVLSSGVPVSINLDEIKSKKPSFSIHFAKWFVNDQSIPIQDNLQFSHAENRFLFKLDFHGIEYEGDITIRYRIKGLDRRWMYASISEQIEYKSIPPGHYTFEVQVVYRSKVYPAVKYNFHISPPFWITWWFILLLLLFVTTVAYLIFRFQIRRLQKKSELQIQFERNKFDLLESEMKALRSQMNPHFIFNSLNSIQDLILREDTDASYDYIVIFSDLVRNALNYSNKEFIPIDKEIEFLTAYLSLEKLRFNDDFSFSITSDIQEEIEVPSMLAQPFVENALLHGLMHQSGPKNISIHFSFDEQLVCTIIDNGVGRKRAKEIQERRGKNHESFALNAIKKRLELLKEQHTLIDVGFDVQDLHDDHTSRGTRVIIRMPYQRKF